MDSSIAIEIFAWVLIVLGVLAFIALFTFICLIIIYTIASSVYNVRGEEYPTWLRTLEEML